MNTGLKRMLRDDISCYETRSDWGPDRADGVLEWADRAPGDRITVAALRRTGERRGTDDVWEQAPSLRPRRPPEMEIVIITLSEHTDWALDDDGAVLVDDPEATTSAVVGCAATPEEAASLIASFVNARPPVSDGYGIGEGDEEVLPISHFTLSAVRLGAPLSEGQAWWAHVDASGIEVDVLAQIFAKSERHIPSKVAP